ncbi:effector protein [Campylobacter sp. faydin G-140]|uniref:effector protein n=1 Tax=Campylobacter anatolicus TaxID=2829105 RepID=UPI001B9CF645|nr:effector protein [Campylobacter anatolicus]MBR8466100.1 effector protein [Campylobacter anatolicus]
MKFKYIQDKNAEKFDFFSYEYECQKEFITLAIVKFLQKNPSCEWEFISDDKRFNSFPNFLFKHQTCISHTKFSDSTFQFRICNEGDIGSFGYRLFINLKDGKCLDFVSNDITKVDDVAMWLKGEILSDFDCISKCGWWITDEWKNMYPIVAKSDTNKFMQEILNSNYTYEMIKINERLLQCEKDGKFKDIISCMKSLD